MNHLGFYRTAPVCLLIVFYGFAIHFGTNPWPVNRIFALSVPIAVYVVLADWTMSWAMNVGEVGMQPEMNGQGRRYVWHGVPVVLYLVLVAAGSVVMLFAGQVQRWLGGAV
jgi:hypothetical protein